MCSKTNVQTQTLGLSAPERLNEQHDLNHFDCGEQSINAFLQKARKNMASGDCVVYVVCELGTVNVKGFFTLSTGAVTRDEAPGKLSRNAPLLIPVTLLGRLGVDRAFQGNGVGLDLIQAAVERSVTAANIVGSRALLVHALDDRLGEMYQKVGFLPSPVSPLTLMLPLPR